VRAAGLFNRALAYRPDDTQLLAEVAGLARRGRLKKRLTSIAFFAGIFGTVVAGLLWWNAARVREAERERAGKARVTALEQIRALTKKALPAAPVKPTQDATPVVAEPEPQEPKKKARVTRSPRASAQPSTVTRSVKTPVVGPQNARVRIDGQLLQWFERHELTVGPHTFEFVPPNNECCETSPPSTVEVVAGEGDQIIRGDIRFRPATLQLNAAEGSHASCGIGGVLVAGGNRSIPMNRASRTLRCTIFPPPGSDGEPKQIDADLRPGRVFILTDS
jgi:hypothetical protein